MPKITDLTGAAPASTDVFAYVDLDDATEAASGTVKKATAAQLVAAGEVGFLPKTAGSGEGVTGILYLDPGADDAANVMRLPVTSSDGADFLFNLNKTTFLSVDDISFNWGFNQQGGGGQVDATTHSWFLQLEHDFNDGGVRYSEYHLNMTLAGSTTYRPFEYKFKTDGTAGSITWRGSTYNFQAIDNSFAGMSLALGATVAASTVNIYPPTAIREASSLTMYGGLLIIQNPAATKGLQLSYADAGPVAYINNSAASGVLAFQNWDTVTLPGWDIRTDQIYLSRTVNINGDYNFIFSGSTGTKFGTGTTQKLGFWGSTPAAQPTVSGTRDTPESALANLLTALDTMGLINDTTTAS